MQLIQVILGNKIIIVLQVPQNTFCLGIIFETMSSVHRTHLRKKKNLMRTRYNILTEKFSKI